MTTPSQPSIISDTFLTATDESIGVGVDGKPSGALNLIPNEVVGYRIVPDEHNWTVVIVRKYGPASKKHGEEYTTPLAYCKNLSTATQWIFSRDARMEGRMNELLDAFQAAEARTLAAVQDVIRQVKENSLVVSDRTLS